jgi:hypothetical protein
LSRCHRRGVRLLDGGLDVLRRLARAAAYTAAGLGAAALGCSDPDAYRGGGRSTTLPGVADAGSLVAIDIGGAEAGAAPLDGVDASGEGESRVPDAGPGLEDGSLPSDGASADGAATRDAGPG